MQCSISSTALAAIHAHAAAEHPREACGLLFGHPGVIAAAAPAPNVAATPETRFEIDPAALLAAHRGQRAGGPNIVGCYHSHPGGDARPSATDADMAAPDGTLWLIVGDNDVTVWIARADGALHGRFDAVELLAP